MQPTNYTGMLTPVDPSQALIGGLKTGNAIEEVQLLNQQRAAQQAALQRQQADLTALTSKPNPTPQDYANYTLRNPSQAEAAKQAFSLLDAGQQQQKIGVASRVYAALSSGRPDLADSILADQEKAQQNGGSPADLQGTQTMRQLIQQDPQNATHAAGLFLSAAMGPKNFAGSFGQVNTAQQNQENAPIQQQQLQANVENTKSQIAARAQDLDIKRADTQIKALTAQLKGETNDIERQKLQGQIQDAQTKRDQLAADKQASGQSAIASFDNALDTISRLRTSPGLSNNFGAYGALPNWPGGEAADAKALIDQLNSQSFLANVKSMVGLGALSDAEGSRITNAAGSLSTSQSEGQFRRQLDSIQKIFSDARERQSKQHGIEATPHAGVIINHPTYGAITEDRLNQAAKKAGITPEALLDRLKQQGSQ